MSLINVVYASAPSDYVILSTLEILVPNYDPIRIVSAYEDVTATLETLEAVTFSAAPFEYQLPSKDTSGSQRLTFSISNVTGEAQKAVDHALTNVLDVPIIYREFLSTDLTAPATTPIKMNMRGGTFQGLTVEIEAGYYDLLNAEWPRKRYIAEEFPGLRYI
jgi:hypothetical protein